MKKRRERQRESLEANICYSTVIAAYVRNSLGRASTRPCGYELSSSLLNFDIATDQS